VFSSGSVADVFRCRRVQSWAVILLFRHDVEAADQGERFREGAKPTVERKGERG